MRNKIAATLRELRKQHGFRNIKPLTRVVESECGIKVVRLPFSDAIHYCEDKKYLLWNDYTGSTRAVELS